MVRLLRNIEINVFIFGPNPSALFTINAESAEPEEPSGLVGSPLGSALHTELLLRQLSIKASCLRVGICAVASTKTNMARGKKSLSGSAKKRRKSEQDRARCGTRVTLKGEKLRWDQFKLEYNLMNDEQVAKKLLDT